MTRQLTGAADDAVGAALFPHADDADTPLPDPEPAVKPGGTAHNKNAATGCGDVPQTPHSSPVADTARPKILPELSLGAGPRMMPPLAVAPPTPPPVAPLPAAPTRRSPPWSARSPPAESVADTADSAPDGKPSPLHSIASDDWPAFVATAAPPLGNRGYNTDSAHDSADTTARIL